MSIAVPKPGLREANSIEADDKESAVAAYYQQYGYGAAQQGYYGQQGAGKGPAVLVSSQVSLRRGCKKAHVDCVSNISCSVASPYIRRRNPMYCHLNDKCTNRLFLNPTR